jgi:hypothetical protein
MLTFFKKSPASNLREVLNYALLLRKKNFVISSATAGMSASPITKAHSRPLRK